MTFSSTVNLSELVDDNLMKNVAMFKNSSFVHFSEFD